MNQQQLMLVILVVAVVLALAVVIAAAVTIRDRRSYRLRPRYGPDYDRTDADVRRAEAALPVRETRRRLHIAPLTADQATRFSDEWQQVQARFVDEPAGAVLQADRLIGDVMQTRGYPVGDFEQRVEDISVDHPDIVMNYRAARAIIEEHARHPVSTEDMRQAMVHYRALFNDLIGDATPIAERGFEPPVGASRERRERP
jgi:hypothetical protein